MMFFLDPSQDVECLVCSERVKAGQVLMAITREKSPWSVQFFCELALQALFRALVLAVSTGPSGELQL